MKIILLSGVFFSLMSVVLGAFGAHGLKAKISPEMLAVFHTGVKFQFYHALGLLALGLLVKQIPSSLLMYSAGLMIAGIICFSGSLYMLAITGNKLFGPITPLGGVFFIIAWVLMFVAVFQADI